jgi:hypothetical protein
MKTGTKNKDSEIHKMVLWRVPFITNTQRYASKKQMAVRASVPNIQVGLLRKVGPFFLDILCIA